MIIPVEIWDLPSDGKLLQERRDDPDFAERLVAAIAAWTPPAPFARIHLAGGGVTDAIAAAFARWPTTVDRDPFAAARRHAPCADIGQTSIKLALGDRTWRIERDFARAPNRDDLPDRASTIAWLAEALAPLAGQRITLALPCEIVDGVPRSCSYAFHDPDPHLVAELAHLARFEVIELVNDAVLAARGAPPRTFVITIGFGVGGAIVQ